MFMISLRGLLSSFEDGKEVVGTIKAKRKSRSVLHSDRKWLTVPLQENEIRFLEGGLVAVGGKTLKALYIENMLFGKKFVKAKVHREMSKVAMRFIYQLMNSGDTQDIRGIAHRKNKTSSSPLKLMRVKNGLTQIDLASRLGISWEMVSRYERGLSVPTKRNIKGLSEALNCEVLDIVRIFNTDIR
jgi:DNA-binding transcriptional regulator YiaG